MFNGCFKVVGIDDILARLRQTPHTGAADITLPAIYQSRRGTFKLDVGDTVFMYYTGEDSKRMALVLPAIDGEEIVFVLNVVTGELTELLAQGSSGPQEPSGEDACES